MLRKDAVVLASLSLALLFIVWALSEASYLPERLHSFLRYIDPEPRPSSLIEYGSHYDLIALGFRFTRIVGFAFLARWLYKGGSEVEALRLHDAPDDKVV